MNTRKDEPFVQTWPGIALQVLMVAMMIIVTIILWTR